MKTLLPILCAAALLVGCKTVTVDDACKAAIAAYQVYVVIMYSDGQPSKDQLKAAQAAAVVLQSQCGWTVSNDRSVATVDGNGVPKLRPPK